MLELQSNVGDFVHQSQQMAKQQGFSCVSKKWYDKTLSFDQVLDKLSQERMTREDIRVTKKAVQVEVIDSAIQLKIEDRVFQPTEHAYKQVCKWLDVPQTLFNYYSTAKEINGQIKYKRDDRDLSLIKSAFDLGLSRLDADKVFLFRTYPGVLRAMLTQDYRVINNEWYLEFLKTVIPHGRFSHDQSDCDTLYGNILFPDRMIDDDNYGAMISIGNSEIGIRKLFQYPSIFRAICMNGCIWDRNSGEILEVVHRGKVDLDGLRDKILENISAQIKLSEEALQRFILMKEKRFNGISTKNIFAQVMLDNSLQIKHLLQIIDEYVKHESDDKNLFGVVNAITRAGQKFDRQTWFDMDCIAGTMMNYTNSQYEKFLNRAKNIEQEKINKIYNLAV